MLASAQLFRADAGLEDYPKIPFGTRVMIVRDPKPQCAFSPIAEPGTVFGPSSYISGGMWTFHKGAIRCRANIAVQGMTPTDLHWVKVHMTDWDPPDAPTPLPDPGLYDSQCAVPSQPVGGAATRDTVT